MRRIRWDSVSLECCFNSGSYPVEFGRKDYGGQPADNSGLPYKFGHEARSLRQEARWAAKVIAMAGKFCAAYLLLKIGMNEPADGQDHQRSGQQGGIKTHKVI